VISVWPGTVSKLTFSTRTRTGGIAAPLSGAASGREHAVTAAIIATGNRWDADFIRGGGSGIGKKRQSQRAPVVGDGDAFVGRSKGAAHPRLDQAAFDADQVGGDKQALLETRPA